MNKIVVMARGNSHSRYFQRFSYHTGMDVEVVQLGKSRFKPAYWRYFKLLKERDIKQYMQPHFAKKRQQFPALSRTPLWPLYQKFSLQHQKLQLVKYCALIEKRNADIVGVWNGQKIPSSSIALAAKLLGKQVIYFEQGASVNAFADDRQKERCQNGFSLDSRGARLLVN